MTHKKTLGTLLALLVTLAGVCSIAGIVSDAGPGPSSFTSLHGATITLYGRGIYANMSAELAPQGIAQDFVTLFLALPLIAISFRLASRGSLRARFVLAGALFYIFTTYLFYLTMVTYNQFFLAYSALVGLSFFSLAIVIAGFDIKSLHTHFSPGHGVKLPGYFLIVLAATIGLLWLGTVVPPLIDGSIYPPTLEHYTTLIVQGFDLGFGLPLGVVSGALLLKRRSYGYLMAPIYLVFLSILMIALVAKIVTLGSLGFNIIPVVFIMPTFAAISIFCSVRLLRSITKIQKRAHYGS